jgi:hypothetical protein
MRPRGLSSGWINISATYGTDKKQPGRQREFAVALAYEAIADGCEES